MAGGVNRATSSLEIHQKQFRSHSGHDSEENPAEVWRDFQALEERRLPRAVAGKGSSSVRGGAPGRRAPAISKSVGATTGSGRIARFEESRAARTQVPPSAKDLKKIERGLKRGPEALELRTASRVAHLIEEECGVRHYASQAWRILRQLGRSCQRPEGRALERDEAKIRCGSRSAGRS